jgi:hypothetical protein
MPNVNYMQCNFTMGEASPQIEGRTDLTKYGNSAATLNNVFVRVFGGAYRRPGTYYAETTKLSTGAVRLFPFQFSNQQAYVVEAGEKYFRFYKDSGILMSNNPIEITSSYAAVELFDLEYAQDADTMYITHTGHPVKKLTRSSHYLWSLANVDFTGGPWEPDNVDSGVTMDPSAVTGNIAVTSSGYAFKAGHSGSLLRINGSNGYVRITEVVSTTLVSATVMKTLVADTATDNWAMGSWNVENGFPQAVSFFEQRLYFAGTRAQPQTVWGSAEENYEDFSPGSDASDAVSFTIADNQVNAIRWLAAGKSLALGTLGGNFLMRSDSSSGPITPSNINIKKETTYGVDLILPRRIGNAVVYVQRNNLTLRELAYNFEEDTQLANDITILSEHITKSGIKDMDYQEAPDGILWCVLKNGKMATLTRLAQQDVMAWTGHETQGSYLSVAVIPNGNEDQVWVAVQRSCAYSATTTNGYIRLVEYFKPFIQPDSQSDSFYVDSGLSYTNLTTKASVVTGMTHMKGRTVSILGDGAVFPDSVVDTAGAVSISKSCNIIHCGLSYTSTIKTSRLESGSNTGSTQGLIKRVYKTIVRLWRSLGCQVGNETTRDIVLFRDSSMLMGSAPLLYTGDKEIQFPIGWNKSAQTYIVQSQPLPMNVLAIVSKVE